MDDDAWKNWPKLMVCPAQTLQPPQFEAGNVWAITSLVFNCIFDGACQSKRETRCEEEEKLCQPAIPIKWHVGPLGFPALLADSYTP